MMFEELQKSRYFKPLVAGLVIYLLVMLYLFLLGFRKQPHELLALYEELPQLAGEKTNNRPKVIQNGQFDAEGFPQLIDDKVPHDPKEAIAGDGAVMKFLRENLPSSMSPDGVLAQFKDSFGHYWVDPKDPRFEEKSRQMADKLSATAARNYGHVKSMATFLEKGAGKEVAATLKENLVKAAQSPARQTMSTAFGAWKNGDLNGAMAKFRQAEAEDPNSPFIQIIAHQSMAFLNMEKHGPLEETMMQFRDLAEESNKYISSFKPALEKAGFDPVKLYGRDPFDRSNLPTKAQMQKAMDQSPYVKYEREFYKTHEKSGGRMLPELLPGTVQTLKNIQKGGVR